MDGMHDLGGRQGFGRIEHEPGTAPFHARWQAGVFACLRGLRGVALQNTDQFRHAVERISPQAYLTHGYYGRWLGALETLAIEAGVISRAALDARVRALGGAADAPVAAQPDVQPACPPSHAPVEQRLRSGSVPSRAAHAARPLATQPRFAIGARVRTADHGVSGHTRLPAYARGRRGTIVAWHDGWVYPDTNAHLLGERPQHLYTVAFLGRELWGDTCEPGTRVSLDLFEPYLEADELPT